jgi:hypothetical protein
MPNSKYDIYKDLSQHEINKIFIDACRIDDIETVDYLLTSDQLQFNAEINKESEEGSVGLCAALASSSHTVAKFLLSAPKLKKHADVHIQDDKPFAFCLMAGKKDFIHFLIFEYNIVKTKSIIEKIEMFDDDSYAEKLFTARELNQGLYTNLKNANRLKL